MTATLLGASLDLSLLRSNPPQTPCVSDSRDILDVNLSTIAGINANALNSRTTTTTGPQPDRRVTASADVAGLGFALAAFPGLLGVSVAESSVTASCPRAGAGVAPTFTATSSFSGVTVLGIPITILDAPVTIDLLGVQGQIIPNYEERTATSIRRVALHVQLSAPLLGTLLSADIGESRLSAADDPCGAPTSGEAPAVTVAAGPANRTVVGHAVPASGAAHDALQSCTISARRAGEPFVALVTTFDGGECAAALDRARFPGPGSYEVRATVTDADGDAGVSPTVTVTVAVPQAGPPAAAGRTLSAAVMPAPGVALAGCAFTVGGVTVSGTIQGGACRATVPGTVPDGAYTVRVEVTDANGDTGQAESGAPLVLSGTAPTVILDPDAPNRTVTGLATPPAGETLTACTIQVRRAGTGAYTTVPSTLSGGRCTATLPRASYAPGAYEALVTVTDGTGDQGQAAGAFSIVTPSVGDPVVDGGTVLVPVRPAPGVPITGCTVTIGSITVAAAYDATSGHCRAALADGLAPGDHRVTTEVVDANGDRATGTGTVTVRSPTVQPDTRGGGGGAPAPPPTFATGTAGELALACTDRKLVLMDVQPSGRQVVLRGAAATDLRGQRVAIKLVATGRVVARPVVGRDGLFHARVAAPAARIARTNAARYVASAGAARSASLKLHRRMATTAVSAATGRVTFSGRVEPPLARTRQTVTLKRLVACGRYEIAGRAKLDARGRYRIRVAPPKGVRAAVYRAEVRAASRARGPARARTFTLPQAIDLP
ncbi:MAG TPA: hypothetical protein VNS09_19210 [Solirubrobacter sp.]|nr:hypothetical protein [Solirubrobacter sp.]